MRREALAINLPEFAQILRWLNMAFLDFGLHQVEFEVKQIGAKVRFDFSSERRTAAMERVIKARSLGKCPRLIVLSLSPSDLRFKARVKINLCPSLARSMARHTRRLRRPSSPLPRPRPPPH